MLQNHLDFRGRARLPVILQSEAAECGLACLGMIASYFGHRIDIDTLRRRHPISLKGVTLRSLIEIARHLNLACRPLHILRCSYAFQFVLLHAGLKVFDQVFPPCTGTPLVVPDPDCVIDLAPTLAI